ncbi:DNA translocase FtsK [Lederbergia sp. NSJ-179]|uniref:DNA translocase FtsK n=1 Tax=Lederbergia sp. NSJ-179 TaxID=2931402 RepID=UPI001FD4BC1E|nr:DNA translocase FtsK [Lederbergia sp. NSJ-179]MCJ7842364.1 DNA translocase FtsK [Lederbergia sp. NSJ-179]
MSWLKRFFLKIMSEEMEEEQQPRQIEKQQQFSSTMETRMTYQYPKGTFRFPLIQDRPKTEDPHTTHRKSEHKYHSVRKEVESSEQNSRPSEKVEELKNNKIESQLKQPFRPTSIPSPIFGYQRPEKANTEYELQDSFLMKSNRIKKDRGSSKSGEDREDSLSIQEEKDEQPTSEGELVKDQAIEKKSEEKQQIAEEPKIETNRMDAHEPNEDEERRPKRKETTRSALPFNVLMLKNDRKNWQERQQKKMKWEQKGSKQEMERKEKSQQEVSEKRTNVESEEIFSEDPQAQRDESLQKSQLLEEDQQMELQAPLSLAVEEQGQPYQYPKLSLLHPPVRKEENEDWLEEQKDLLNETLTNFNVQAQVVQVSQGPSVTRFEVQPERGVKVNKITNLSDDIKLSMAARDIRMEAPIPGKRTIGIEIPNQESRPVQLSEIIGDRSFLESQSPLTAALGLDISGKSIVTDLQKMPHGLIAGATGSGKSVCINSILVSLLYKARPDELKLLLIDPKMVELAPYNHIPHLVSPVITDVKAATASLKWAVEEMERRYELFAHASVRNIGRFNELAEESRRFNEKLPYIVIIIDELADLMMMAPHDVEESICRIAQKARACGIHLIIATQRPSVDVITGLIKANVPTRIAFSVSSQVDSRTIIDIGGAEKLLGRGDMLFLGSGSSKPVRLQGTFVSDQEIDRIIEHVRSQGDPDYLFEQEELLKKAQVQDEEDDLYLESCEFIVKQGSASTSMLQRQFRIGYNRAARLIDMMEHQGVISEAKGSKPRDVLITQTELDALKETTV